MTSLLTKVVIKLTCQNFKSSFCNKKVYIKKSYLLTLSFFLQVDPISVLTSLLGSIIKEKK